MRLTKHTHSCVRLDDGDAGLVVDPGSFSSDQELAAVLDGVHAVLVTHEHPDHLHVDAVVRAAAADPDLHVWAPAAVCDLLAAAGDERPLEGRCTAVDAGESFLAGGLEVRTHGSQHALIHRSVPVVANVGYLVGGVFHPGDQLTVPDEPVEHLLVPLHAPWSKVAEVVDHVVAVRAPHVHPVHDGLLNERGIGVVAGHVERIGARHGSSYEPLAPGETVLV